MESKNTVTDTRPANGNGPATTLPPPARAKIGSAPAAPEATGEKPRPKIESLKYYEDIVSQFLDHEDTVADAIYQIKVRKLYKETGQNFQDYVRARWDISRSRANQLIQFVKEKEKALANGAVPPANERAARKLRAGSSAVDYEQSRKKSITHIDRTVDRLPLDKRVAYVSELMQYLEQLSRRLRAMPTSGATPPAADRTGRPTGTPRPDPALPEPILPAPVLPEPPRPVEAAAFPVGSIPLNPAAVGSHRYGGVTPLTMEQARAAGFVKKR